MYVYILLQAHVSICRFFARIFQDISFFPNLNAGRNSLLASLTNAMDMFKPINVACTCVYCVCYCFIIIICIYNMGLFVSYRLQF